MTTAHIVTLGCARNETDSEELAGRLQASGYEFVADPADAEVLLVNTCGFIEAAKKDSIDTLLAALELRDSAESATQAVIAVGCMAQRYRAELAAEMPELDSVLTFDDYSKIAPRIGEVALTLAGGTSAGVQLGSGRTAAGASSGGAPTAGAARQRGQSRQLGQLGELGHLGRIKPSLDPAGPSIPVGGSYGQVAPDVYRTRLADSPYAPLKIASGCERRCAFCAIPSIRGSYVSRSIDDIAAEAEWLVGQGVREVMLVSENTTSYGKDLRERLALERLISRLSAVDGLEWIRLSYLQPAELRPSLIDAIGSTPKVVPYFDLSFQHASARVLKRMRRFGDAESFLSLLGDIKARCPRVGLRTNVIVGFPGETSDDLAVLRQFLGAASFDSIGVFGYSDEEGTEAYSLPGHIPDEEISERVRSTSELAEWLCDERAAQRVGECVDILVESDDGQGRAAHQGPEVDGSSRLVSGGQWVPGTLVRGVIVGSDGVDLLVEPVPFEVSASLVG